MEIGSELSLAKEGTLKVASGIKNEGAVFDMETGGRLDGVGGSTFNDKKAGINNYLPRHGMEFETKEAAYSFYREYARSVGFEITIKSSRRSKKSGKFIDIKLACSRFGRKRGSNTTTTSRSCPKTDCKASMYVKKRAEGKWYIYSFVEEHNHEICADDFCNSNRGRKNQDTSAVSQKKGLQLVLDERDVQLLFDHFANMQAESPGFYYVIDFAEEARMRNVFWVDSKGRHNYASFSDVIFFDTHYIRSKYNVPFVPIIGVNHHFQYIMLGCALIADETKATLVWLMRTWLRAVGGHSPQVVITDTSKSLIESVNEVFPDASHCFCPWHVFSKVGSNLSHKLSEVEAFLMKFKKCTYRSQTDEELETGWQKMVNKFDLVDDKWMQFLYENRRKWIPTYMRNVFFGGFCTVERSQSLVSSFDKYLLKETTVVDFIDHYKLFLQENSEEEAKAEIETRCSQPTLISHSPFEKQVSNVYTYAIYQKFQAEVSGIADCMVLKEDEDERTTTFTVDDLRSKHSFTVSWDVGKYGICCLCGLFEYNGLLCRHSLSVLQHLGFSTFPSNYILRRWTRDAKMRDATDGASANTNFRRQRLNGLCRFAVKLGKEASLSQETYQVACHAIQEALKQCVGVNNSVRTFLETNKTVAQGISVIRQKEDNNTVEASKTKKSLKKQKVQAEAETSSIGVHESNQDVGHLNSLPSLGGFYYSDQAINRTVLGNTNAVSTHAGHHTTQHSLQGMGQYGFRATTSFQLRSNLHDPGTSANMASKHKK